MNTKSFFSDNNHLSENGIALYVDAIKLERIDNLPAAIVHHVEECEECKMQIMEVAELLAGEQFDKTMNHPFFSPKEAIPASFSVIYRIAAVFVIAAFIGTIYYFLANRMPETTQNNQSAATEQKNLLPVHKDSLAIEHKQSSVKPTDDLFAVNYEPSPNLEDLVQTQFRSTTIEIISPAIGEIVRNPITFRWKQYDKRITIKILSNKELTLVSSTLSKDS
ncbi:MAG: hypothetical protein Q8L88_13960, partial [Bacteroidota bacterium]|nr:hypothetical protein [Bacteroidota bacterium]